MPMKTIPQRTHERELALRIGFSRPPELGPSSREGLFPLPWTVSTLAGTAAHAAEPKTQREHKWQLTRLAHDG